MNKLILSIITALTLPIRAFSEQVIIEDYYSETYLYDIDMLLVHWIDDDKYAVYAIDYWDECQELYQVVSNHSPLNYDIAKFIFKKVNENNYVSIKAEFPISSDQEE